jgi:hypothetical protein
VGGGRAEWVSVGVGVGVGVGDVKGLGDVELVADGTALCVGVEVAALPHPAVSESTSKNKNTANLMSSPYGAIGPKEPYGWEGTPACRLGDVMVTLRGFSKGRVTANETEG